jgi:hypothetical protein
MLSIANKKKKKRVLSQKMSPSVISHFLVFDGIQIDIQSFSPSTLACWLDSLAS